ncbi:MULTISPECIES: YdbL family protein [Shewanella]|uniref:YdbL family protein n=1 Tax=Shewanella TaxID=22 RepID=UPI001C658546|nr:MULTISPECIES: YdbL family protein [Shewanella]QYJ80880.1 YdbL family protein [Shewanella aegiceratis]QYJ96114.1 YdbL family protein [Shewanella alkalitolerans]
MKSKILLLMAGLLLSLNAFAISLQDAKAQGLVGEQVNGYLGVVVSNSEASALAKSVNAKRKAHYEKIARKNQISVDDVAKLAAEKAIAATAKGHYIQTPQGKWVKK